MSSVLLRAIKRFTSWEKSPEEFYEMELTNGAEADLSLSVYEVVDEGPKILQVLSEHWASTKDPNPHSPCRALDASGKHEGKVEETPGTGCFEFTRIAHREVRFMEESQVRQFAGLLMSERASRTRGAGRDEIRRYMAERFVANDAEWSQLAANKPDWLKWASKQAKLPTNVSQKHGDKEHPHTVRMSTSAEEPKDSNGV